MACHVNVLYKMFINIGVINGKILGMVLSPGKGVKPLALSFNGLHNCWKCFIDYSFDCQDASDPAINNYTMYTLLPSV